MTKPNKIDLDAPMGGPPSFDDVPPQTVVHAEPNPNAPTIGRVVHYLTEGTEKTRPALVLSVNSDESVDLTVFNESGANYLALVPFAEEPHEGHWSWPPRN